MTPYRNLSGDAGVAAYEDGPDYINVLFRSNSKVYVYDYSRPGRSHVEQMKRLAALGKGLTTYISQSVRENYSRKG